ncbi:6-phosphogluconolactonase [Streptomyces sp. ST2-7A]|uniref:6-phosphogluconolactonase n=1 Tax=Streptomyces sp. ST2-7A TaxID=2907214 RepID=UPI001F3A1BD7|nr:6-phosphogluconolactonase [Streptomyces sp. ST2-7A]MCE7082735.1 6-phosphogluconolactonase [Streptomyces sp. ST2-7A]
MTAPGRVIPRVLVHRDAELLAAAAAARLLTRIVDAQSERGSASVVLTGGRNGIALLRAVAAAPAREAVDWSRVDLWWGDERYLPAGDPDRNETQAREALLDSLPLDPARVHAMPAVAPDTDPAALGAVEAAAERYAAELAAASPDASGLPGFDVLLLGVGPDTHVASLFPDHPALEETGRTVVAVRGAPKPPAERVTLTRPAIRGAREVWLLAAGKDKAGAVATALSGADGDTVPAAGVHGLDRTLWLLDISAAAQLPERIHPPAAG